jgi:hypothetical protein
MKRPRTWERAASPTIVYCFVAARLAEVSISFYPLQQKGFILHPRRDRVAQRFHPSSFLSGLCGRLIP